MPEDHEVSRARKRAKKENSLKHGVYSREVMLPGENIRCYETLVAETTEEWAPEGATERSLVDRLVGLFWRRQRLERYEQSKLQERIKEIRECNLSNRVSELKDLGPRFENAASDERRSTTFWPNSATPAPASSRSWCLMTNRWIQRREDQQSRRFSRACSRKASWKAPPSSSRWWIPASWRLIWSARIVSMRRSTGRSSG